uniref:Uncharacterized protein n=1 Tax=Arundo donax TaxID=35708 RepID=A0A0A9FA91_ARUDO
MVYSRYVFFHMGVIDCISECH